MALIDKASLLMVPSVYEDGTLYNVLPSGNKAPDETGNHNGYDQTRADFTFSRGFNLTATRVNANGLIEKGRENLLTYSNDFSQWSNSGTTETSGQADKDGGTDAWLLTKSTADGYIYQDVSQSGVQTYSVYLKANALNWARVQLNGSGADKYAYFDLANGVIGGSGSGNIDENIESVGNGWYRCSIVADTTSTRVRIYPADGDNDVSGTSGSIYIQDAQLEAGLVATDYIESGSVSGTAGVLENTPRIDYSSGAGALLLESQRTNKITNSEYINTTTFNYNNGLTINNNEAISPEGIENAAKIIATTANSRHELRTSLATASGYDMVSCFVKASGYNYVQLTSWADPANYVNFDLTDGSIGSIGMNGPTIKGIEDYGNGWYRIHANVQASGGGMIGIGIVTSASAGWAESFTGNGTDGLLIWGLQIEAGSHVSSYVPTYGSAATRGADSGVSDVDSLLTSNATYTWFVEFIVPESGIGGGEITFKDAGGSSQLRIYCNQNNTIGLRVEDGGQTHFINVSVGDTAKCLFQCSNGLVKGFYNGSLVHTFTIDAGMDAQKIHLGPPISAPDVKEVLLFNEALSDAECVTLTTL